MLSDKEIEIVNNIYNYWFEGDLTINYKTKWFPSGNIDIQHKADCYIYKQYNDIFNKAINGSLNHWKTASKKSMLALILVFDQFSRHIYRYMELNLTDPRRIIADQYGLLCAEELHQTATSTVGDTSSGVSSTLNNYINNNNNSNNNAPISNLNTSELIFSMLPYRHSATVSRLEYVIHVIEDKEQGLTHDASLLNKFRKQTVRRLQHLQDRDKVGVYVYICVTV